VSKEFLDYVEDVVDAMSKAQELLDGQDLKLVLLNQISETDDVRLHISVFK
jgi:hypothetical protein